MITGQHRAFAGEAQCLGYGLRWRQCRQPRAQTDERRVQLRRCFRIALLELENAPLDFLHARPGGRRRLERIPGGALFRRKAGEPGRRLRRRVEFQPALEAPIRRQPEAVGEHLLRPAALDTAPATRPARLAGCWPETGPPRPPSRRASCCRASRPPPQPGNRSNPGNICPATSSNLPQGRSSSLPYCRATSSARRRASRSTAVRFSMIAVSATAAIISTGSRIKPACQRKTGFRAGWRLAIERCSNSGPSLPGGKHNNCHGFVKHSCLPPAFL